MGDAACGPTRTSTGSDFTQAERGRARSPAELSNLVRYEVLKRSAGSTSTPTSRRGGRSTTCSAGVKLFAALELPGRVACGIVGAVPGHRAMERAARLSRQTLGLGPHSADANGPYFLSLLLEQEPEATIFGADKFYPYRWDEPERAGEPFPGAYAVHHWSTSWWAQEPGLRRAEGTASPPFAAGHGPGTVSSDL